MFRNVFGSVAGGDCWERRAGNLKILKQKELLLSMFIL
jgi:hypothetical protein